MSQSCYVLEKRPNPDLLSLVIPIYNEEEVFPLLLTRLKSLLQQLPGPAEVILVNDGSRDGSIHQLLAVAKEDPRFKVVSLARNFGHQIAATAGLDHTSGDAVVLMDADLQDPPEVVLEMIAKYRDGYDVVYARRLTREGETWFKKVTAWGFYRVMRWLIHKDLPIDVGDFRLMSRPCLDALISMREMHRFLRGMVTWIGFAQTEVNFHRPARAAGETKYPLSKMLQFAWNAAISFSPLPLQLCFTVGLIFSILSVAYGSFAIFAVLAKWDIARGWASSIAFTGFTGGVVLMSIGILGEYVGRIFEEVKGRPLYVVGRLANLAPKTTFPSQ